MRLPSFMEFILILFIMRVNLKQVVINIFGVKSLK
uniref:Uncharacterized protein n=1 Tax=CrAss-like virus sp. ctYsL76 TaxID=2826826 RepID=A0A8S5QN33_9CAUD|nr:MAG TPA: hypothetical protein [CrAss-like virus sp. ctYsL76]